MTDQMLCEIAFEHSPIPDKYPRLLLEVTIKREGCAWRIHKNDSDPFPSNPHAHNVETGLKLDLSNEKLYLGTKDTGENISKKNLDFIRLRAKEKAIQLPTLSL